MNSNTDEAVDSDQREKAMHKEYHKVNRGRSRSSSGCLDATWAALDNEHILSV